MLEKIQITKIRVYFTWHTQIPIRWVIVIYYWPFQGGASAVVLCFCSIICPLSVYVWNFIQNSPVANCWEKAVILAFWLCCFTFLSVSLLHVPFPFCVWGRMWNLSVSVLDHCLSIYFTISTRVQPVLVKNMIILSSYVNKYISS